MLYEVITLRKNLCTPSMPLVSQGLDCSKGPKNISYKRKVSAPYCSTITSGLTTLYIDLDIRITSYNVCYTKLLRAHPIRDGKGDRSRRVGLQANFLRLQFLEKPNPLMESMGLVIPSAAFMLIMIFSSIFTLVIIVRQKRVDQIKNDFINRNNFV